MLVQGKQVLFLLVHVQKGVMVITSKSELWDMQQLTPKLLV